jgi:hypothetical protein
MIARSVTTVEAPHLAVNYREKARRLHEMAASAANDQLHDDFETLARQYEQLAVGAEIL